MSYILDALKKSDQERQQSKGPSLQTVHRPVSTNKQSPMLVLIVAMLSLLLVVALVAAWLMFSETKVVNNDAIPKKESVINTEVSDKRAIEQQTPLLERSPKVTAPVSINSSAVRFNDLDSKTRAAIPGLTFSFHVYSDNPQRRTIIINGRRVKEREWVEQGLLLEEITSAGVVFVWRNSHRFSIDVVESW